MRPLFVPATRQNSTIDTIYQHQRSTPSIQLAQANYLSTWAALTLSCRPAGVDIMVDSRPPFVNRDGNPRRDTISYLPGGSHMCFLCDGPGPSVCVSLATRPTQTSPINTYSCRYR